MGIDSAVQTTLITASGTGDSAERYGCPGVHRVEGHSDHFVISREVADPAVLKALAPHVGVDAHGRPEHVGATPPWVPCQLMSLSTLERFMDDHLHRPGDTVFRYEGLPLFNVSTDPNWLRWQSGATSPDWTVKRAWTDELTAHREAGIDHQRVRRFEAELSEHELYACNWGYALNSRAGEDIRVLREGEHDIPENLLEVEYWTVNAAIAVPVLYDARGRFLGAGWLAPEDSTEHLDDQARVWQASEPFESWWDRHPEFHRPDRLVA